ncbi:hypothetical protein BDZ90DRAFT_261861 [Jaminaea rosea]|uniref:Uncharacterized protein n=1 Tax=Jaminaea rosea TaxID=1569628 RepID=A0A316ULC4_9BASI|nr:hypothetical protein BDZ90DRAFT_261861 [Jaminaea rosea]PWN26092.1 hypothetical protein BDZ90DRAFT_261861 [Jaminaea rosea]
MLDHLKLFKLVVASALACGQVALTANLGTCFSGPSCSGNITGVAKGKAGPGAVTIFNFNCPTFQPLVGEPYAHKVQVCHKINGQECTDCTTVSVNGCYPVPASQQWVGICVGK